jgi:hypothetical protein
MPHFGHCGAAGKAAALRATKALLRSVDAAKKRAMPTYPSRRQFTAVLLAAAPATLLADAPPAAGR